MIQIRAFVQCNNYAALQANPFWRLILAITQDQCLQGVRILVTEDDAILAFDLETLLRDAGAKVLGPAATLAATLALAGSEPLACTLLDVNLRGGTVFPAAKVLRERGIRMIFHTGCGEWNCLRDDWPGAQILTKPASSKLLLRTLCEVCCPYRSSCGLLIPA